MREAQEKRSELSIALFVVQILGVPVEIFVTGFIAMAVLPDQLGKGLGRTQRGIIEDVVGYLFFAFQGLIFGYSVQNGAPRSIRSGGKWVWVLPICCVVYGCLDALLVQPSDLPVMFWPGSKGWEGIWFLFITLPALGCCFYSLGVVLAAMRARR